MRDTEQRPDLIAETIEEQMRQIFDAWNFAPYALEISIVS